MEKIFQTDPNQTNYGKAYAVNRDQHVVLVGDSHPKLDRYGAIDFEAFSYELKPGWRWATQGDLAPKPAYEATEGMQIAVETGGEG